MTRELPAIYRIVAEAIKDAVPGQLIPPSLHVDWDEDSIEAYKLELVKKLCEDLKANDSRFDADKFQEAAWGEDF